MWLAILVAGVVLAGLDLLAPRLPAAEVAAPLASLGAVVGLLAGIRLNRPPTVRPWLAIGAGVACLAVGDLLDARRGLLLHGDREPALGDLPHLLAYPLLATGFLLLAHDRRPGDRSGRIEAWIIGAGAALVFVELLIWPTLDAGPGSTVGTLVSTAYPVGDVLLVLGVARLAMAAAGRTPAGRLLLGAGLLLLSADTISILFAVYATPHPVVPDALRLVSYAAFAAAALHPGMAALSRQATAAGPGGISRVRLGVVGLAALIAPGLLVLEKVIGVEHDSWAIVVGSIVLFGLVFARMVVAIEQVEEVNRSRADLQDQLAYDAAHDALTSLPNRARGFALTRRALADDRGSGGTTALLFIDLDGFKYVNDTLGHRSGDEVLRRVGNRLRESVRGDDSAIRYGGDEFLVLLRNVEAAAAMTVAERLIETISRPIPLGSRSTAQIGASVGVAVATAGTTDAVTLIAEADAAAYIAKSSGRGRAHLFDDSMRKAAALRRSLEQDLRDGIERDELVLHYQPIVNTRSGVVEGYEALVRWERPGAGLLPPDVFLPVAEASDLICEVDRWVLGEAARQLVAWSRTFGPDQLYVSVNLSTRHVAQPRVIEDVAWALDESGVEPHRLVLETGEAALADPSGSVAHLRRLRELGVRVTVDDFGSGFSSLARLADMPVDMVKIDRRYVDVGTAPAGRLLHLMIEGAHAVGLSAVAQGVEHDAQLEALRSLDCEAVQGFHIARPMPAAEAEDYYRNQVPDPFVGLLSRRSGS